MGDCLPRLLVFPGSLSSWRAEMVAQELQVRGGTYCVTGVEDLCCLGGGKHMMLWW